MGSLRGRRAPGQRSRGLLPPPESGLQCLQPNRRSPHPSGGRRRLGPKPRRDRRRRARCAGPRAHHNLLRGRQTRLGLPRRLLPRDPAQDRLRSPPNRLRVLPNRPHAHLPHLQAQLLHLRRRETRDRRQRSRRRQRPSESLRRPDDRVLGRTEGNSARSTLPEPDARPPASRKTVCGAMLLSPESMSSGPARKRRPWSASTCRRAW